MYIRIFPRRKVEVSLKEISVLWKSICLRGRRAEIQKENFEKEFARYIGVKHAIIVPSARAGLSILLDSLEFQEGDEIVLSSYNYHVIPALIKLKGFKPVFIDIDPDRWNINTALIEGYITPKTRCIIATHLFGKACNIEEIVRICRKYSLILIEDVAHSCGAAYGGIKLGKFGDAAYFSFGMGKALVAFGGGMLVTDKESIYIKVRERLNNITYSKRNSKVFIKMAAEVCFTNKAVFSLFIYPIIVIMNLIGSDLIDRLFEDKYILEDGKIDGNPPFYNFQAAVGLIQLKRLDRLNNKRICNARLLSKLLSDIDKIKVPSVADDGTHVVLYYCVVTNQIKALRKYLALRGMDTKRGTIRACSALNFFNSSTRCPIAEKISDNVIELPCYPNLTVRDIYYQANLMRKFYGSKLLR